ncbi:helix-turn-helix transcriptional regulator [Nocardia sp. NPDC004711]
MSKAEACARFGDADSLCAGVQSMLFVHCGVMERETLVRRSEQVLDGGNCAPDAGCLWLALLVLVYADRPAEAAAYCDHLLSGRAGAIPRPTFEVLTLIRARINAQAGRPAEAVRALGPLLSGRVSASLRGIAMAWMVEALVQFGDIRTARRLADGHLRIKDALPDRAHVLAARGALHRAEGDLERSLADYIECGKVLTSLNVANPAIIPWRAHAALVAHALGRDDLASALADDELALARRWGSPGAVGRALHAVGIARRTNRSIAVLERAVELLDLADARHDLMETLCDLGQLHAAAGDAARSQCAVESVTQLAVEAGNRHIVQRAKSVLATLDNQRRTAKLTRQEHKIACLASQGHSNKTIAATMFLTIRTVEFHLSNVYRKLEISGRRQLEGVMNFPKCA